MTLYDITTDGSITRVDDDRRNTSPDIEFIGDSFLYIHPFNIHLFDVDNRIKGIYRLNMEA